MISVLFVCLGNICRSPTAQAILRDLVQKKQLTDCITVSSCATHDYNTGESPDPRMQQQAKKRGYVLKNTARQFVPEADFELYDYIIVMDDTNYRDIAQHDRCGDYKHKIYNITEFCSHYKACDHVPDPYFGGDAGFQQVIDLLEDACLGLLKEIEENHAQKN